MKIDVEIMHCPTHDFYCIAIGDRRTIGAKCCGQWKPFRTWTVDASTIQSDVKAAIDATRLKHPARKRKVTR